MREAESSVRQLVARMPGRMMVTLTKTGTTGEKGRMSDIPLMHIDPHLGHRLVRGTEEWTLKQSSRHHRPAVHTESQSLPRSQLDTGN